VTEHGPSRVVLLAKKKFFIDGKWHTWIDYEKFHANPSCTTDEYMKETPTYCLVREDVV
jgi:tRNA wybutosine-synthesizing protein 1